MALPRASKKSSFTSLLQTTPCQEIQQVRKQVHEAMQDLDEFDDASAFEMDSEDKEGVQTQEPQDRPLAQLMTRMVGDQRKRHAKCKQKVHDAYNLSYEAAHNSINDIFDEHERQASSVHKVQLQHLQDLLTRKAKIEADMADKLATLRASYDAHSRDLEAVLARRIKEME